MHGWYELVQTWINFPQQTTNSDLLKMLSVKRLVETAGCLKSIPSKYVVPTNSHDFGVLLEPEEVIPSIDLSLLTSGSPDQRSRVVQQIGYACREWGFFMVTNHGVPKTLMEEMIEASQSFFDLTEEQKREYSGQQVLDPIKYGTSFNVSVDKVLFWRDLLKIHVHPRFNSPTKPSHFSDILREFSRRVREAARELFKGISLSLGLDECYIHNAMELDGGSQVFVANCYPPCPQPESAMGLPPHTDHGLLTLLMQNGLSGLQVQHKGKWVLINPLPYAFLVNTGDHMEILSNGIYKSVIHRAVVNNKATRISVGIANGPPLDKIVQPAPELVKSGSRSAAYRGITYREYLKLQQSNELNGNSCLNHIRLNN